MLSRRKRPDDTEATCRESSAFRGTSLGWIIDSGEWKEPGNVVRVSGFSTGSRAEEGSIRRGAAHCSDPTSPFGYIILTHAALGVKELQSAFSEMRNNRVPRC